VLPGPKAPIHHEQAIDKAEPTGPDIQNRGIGDSGVTRCKIKAAPKSYDKLP